VERPGRTGTRDKAIGRAAEDLLGDRFEVGHAAVVVEVHDRVQRRAEDRAPAGLALAERLLGLQALGEGTSEGHPLAIGLIAEVADRPEEVTPGGGQAGLVASQAPDLVVERSAKRRHLSPAGAAAGQAPHPFERVELIRSDKAYGAFMRQR
jgi:hypothetical protein